jgi:hypothetical protein
MKMQTIFVIICLGLLLRVEPASAQKEYLLKVSIHEEVPPLTNGQVEQILERASKLLKHRNGCDVKFKLDGPIKTFASAPKDINNAYDLEAVHSVDADVKVVRKINFCKGRPPFIGCAWRADGPKTMIVTRRLRSITHILWAHEFGHTKGLQHRLDRQALMTPCNIALSNVEINSEECRCLTGPGGCAIPVQDIVCPPER